MCLRMNRGVHSHGLRTLLRGASRLGDGVAWYALMLALPMAYGMSAWPVVARMMAAGLIGLALYKWLKSKTSRPRPYQVYADIVAGCPSLDRFSFPSGHTLHAVCFTLIACHAYPELWPLLGPFSALIAVSRPVLGVHYPSDVLAGAGLGALIALVAIGT
ncbi:MAG: hypothetical protein AMXMBFR6_06810 [Betaproteobacteria bacterium]